MLLRNTLNAFVAADTIKGGDEIGRDTYLTLRFSTAVVPSLALTSKTTVLGPAALAKRSSSWARAASLRF
jgi:hypothetical protein